MPQSNPSTAQLIDSVCRFLEADVLASVEGRLAFDTRVAINALKIAARDITLSAQLDQGEQQRLSALLGQEGDLATLNDQLCEAISGGEIDLSSAELYDHLRCSTMGKLAIDNPRYSTYQQLLKTESDTP